MEADTLDRYADLIVRFGANVQPGQRVLLSSSVGKEQLTRAIAARLYQLGAVFVHTSYGDPHLQRLRIEHGVDEALGYEPDWVVQMFREHGEQHGASIALSGNPAPGLLDGLDPDRVGKDQPPGRRQMLDNLQKSALNWTIAPCPTVGWATLVHPDLEPEQALERLWAEVLHMCRADEDDPVAAWEQRIDQLNRAKAALDGLQLDSLHLEGPGTDLVVGLLPTARWQGGFLTSAAGIVHHPNVPSEEVFAVPDPQRVDGVVRSTKPRELVGSIVRDFTITFEGGRMTDLEAAAGEGVLRAYCGQDEGASRLGEIALVDSGGRVGPLDTVFYDTVLDENAASHMAFGNGFEWAVGDADKERVNQSRIHVDLMVGSDEVNVTGVTRSGERVPLLRGGDWQML
jgi:aminopeptidase